MVTPDKSSDDEAGLAGLAQRNAKVNTPAQDEKAEAADVQKEAAAAEAPAAAPGEAAATEAQPSAADTQQVKQEEPAEHSPPVTTAKGAGKKVPLQRRGSKRDRRAPEHFDPNEDYKHGKGATRQGSTAKDDDEGEAAGPPTKKARKGPGNAKGKAAQAEDEGDDEEPGIDKAPTFDDDEDEADKAPGEVAGDEAEPATPRGGRGRGGRGGKGGRAGRGGRGRGRGKGRGRGGRGRGRGRSVSREASPKEATPAAEAVPGNPAAPTTAAATGTPAAPAVTAAPAPDADLQGEPIEEAPAAAAAAAPAAQQKGPDAKPAAVEAKPQQPIEQPAAAAPATSPKPASRRRLKKAQPQQAPDSDDDDASPRLRQTKTATVGSPSTRRKSGASEAMDTAPHDSLDAPSRKLKKAQLSLQSLKCGYDNACQQASQAASKMADVLREVQAMDGVGAEQLRATGAGKMVTALGKELKGQPLMQDAAAAASELLKHWKAKVGKPEPGATPTAASKPAAGQAALRAADSGNGQRPSAAAVTPGTGRGSSGGGGAAGRGEDKKQAPAAPGAQPRPSARQLEEPRNEMPALITTGSADRDKAIGLLTLALAPAHSPAAAARRLEAALHELHDSKDRRDDYVRRLMALRYMLSRDSEAHIPVLRDKVMMGEISMYEVVTLQDAEAAALAGRPWPPVSDADAAAGAGSDGGGGQQPAAMEVAGGTPGAPADDAAPLVGPLLPGGSYLAGGPMSDAAPGTTPQQPAGPPPQLLQLPDSGAATAAQAASTAMAATSMEVDGMVPPPPPPEVCGVPTSGGATSPAAPPPPKPMEPGQSDPDAVPLAAAAGGQPIGSGAADGLMPADVPPAPELGPNAELSQALLPMDVGPRLGSASEQQIASQPEAMALGSMLPPSLAASDPESQPPAPPPLESEEPVHSGAADPLAAAGAALPALHTAAGLQGFASPPLQGQEVPVVTTAETPTTTMISGWWADTPTQPEPASQGGLSLPPFSQQDL